MRHFSLTLICRQEVACILQLSLAIPFACLLYRYRLSFIDWQELLESAMTLTNRQMRVVRVPTDQLMLGDFEMAEAAMPTPAEGELLVKTRLISIDAANRAWLQGLTYRTRLSQGEVMAGLAISEVVASRSPDFSPGDIVYGDTGWQEFAAVAAKKVERQPLIDPLTHLLSLYGTSSLTAYFGLTCIGALKPGEVIAVSAAAGSVGLAVGQMAKLMGAKVVGITGGPEKCRWLTEQAGFDHAIDYKSGALSAELRSLGSGIDVYFDNVGGDTLERCLFAMNSGGRIVCCGAVSAYDTNKPQHGPRGVPGLLVTKRLMMKGFIVTDFAEQQSAALAQIRHWVEAGQLLPYEHVVDGLEQAPAALLAQLAGANRGKMIVRVSG